MKRWSILGLAAVMALSLSACGGGDSGGGGGSDFDNTATLNVTSVSPNADFTTTGKFTVSFVAQDANGSSILASSLADLDIELIETKGMWTKTVFKGDPSSSVTTLITTPADTTGTAVSLTSVAPSAGSKVMGAAILDDSGSMASTDPSMDRVSAANAFINSICDCTSGASCASTDNSFSAFDFGPSTDGRDLLTAFGATIDNASSGLSLPYAACSDANVTSAQSVINTTNVTSSGGTPLYNTLKTACDNIGAASASGGQLESFNPAILLLSDGGPTDPASRAAALQSIGDNSVTVCTVGLGPASELGTEYQTGCKCSADADCVAAFAGDTCVSARCQDSTQACTSDDDCSSGYGYCDTTTGHCYAYACTPVLVLKEIAEVGSCVYSSAADAASLQAIFDSIGIAVSQGYNQAVFALDPIPPTGTTVEGTLQVGTTITATFSFVAP